jgi:purine-nucleoside phosphorylase
MSLHIEAGDSDIAEGILLPGDPLRAKGIAEYFLSDVICYNKIRGMLGYTGTWKGRRVSVQGTGMGMPSLSIYAHELIQHYGVQKMIRVGTAGSIQETLGLRSIVMATGACTDSALNKLRFNGMDYAAIPDFNMARKAADLAESRSLPLVAGNVLAADAFYSETLKADMQKWADYGVLCAEMESTELFTLAARHRRRALTLLTITDNIPKGESLPPAERQNDFIRVAELALDVLLES